MNLSEVKTVDLIKAVIERGISLGITSEVFLCKDQQWLPDFRDQFNDAVMPPRIEEEL